MVGPRANACRGGGDLALYKSSFQNDKFAVNSETEPAMVIDIRSGLHRFVAMSENTIWYGFLEAGVHSSPVVRDTSLQTKSRKTMYLYNHLRGKFLEYSCEIVEPKLRELDPGDIPLKQLSSAFKAARKAFVHDKVTTKWEDTPLPAPVRKVEEPEEVMDDDFPADMAEEY